jgi:hypothetical protein
MAKLNSSLTRIRLVLARKLDPFPPRGEAWCFGCRLVGGANVAFPSEQLQAHVSAHKMQEPPGYVNIRCMDPVKENA